MDVGDSAAHDERGTSWEMLLRVRRSPTGGNRGVNMRKQLKNTDG